MPSSTTVGRTPFPPFGCNQAAVRNAINAGLTLFQAFSPIPLQGSIYCDCLKVGRKIECDVGDVMGVIPVQTMPVPTCVKAETK